MVPSTSSRRSLRVGQRPASLKGLGYEYCLLIFAEQELPTNPLFDERVKVVLPPLDSPDLGQADLQSPVSPPGDED
jgi:hypothetical protein